MVEQSYLTLVLRLSRANMTVISGATHLAAALLSTSLPGTPHFSMPIFLSSYFFILFTQFTVHFLGELHDIASDKLNTHATPLTGGSRVLVSGQLSRTAAKRLAALAACSALSVLLVLVPPSARLIGLLMFALALCYTTPPICLNYRALGELDAAFITSVLVPHFSAVAQHAVSPIDFPARSLAILTWPPFLAKIALFLVLNQADRRPDWQAGKHTLAVHIGDRAVAILHAVLMAAAYGAAFVIAALDAAATTSQQPKLAAVLEFAVSLAFLLPSLRLAVRLLRALLPVPPYSLDGVLPLTLLHATVLVWAVISPPLLRDLWREPRFGTEYAFVMLFAWLGFRNFIRPHGKHKQERDGLEGKGDAQADVEAVAAGNVGPLSNVAETRGMVAGGVSFGETSAAESPLQATDTSTGGTRAEIAMTPPHGAHVDVVVVGGGVAGLVTAISLNRLSRSVVLLERRPASSVSHGADLALWPGAISILRHLGIPDDFFTHECYPLRSVHMCNMRFEATERANGAAKPVAEILKTIDMQAVTQESGESFVLVARDRLMEALWRLVPKQIVRNEATVVSVREDDESESVDVEYAVATEPGLRFFATGRVVIAADGARSVLRGHVSPEAGGAAGIRFCNEVCFRGVLDLSSSPELSARVTPLLPDAPTAGVMRINYGAGLRSSFGFMSADGRSAYWWVKQPATEPPQHQGKLAACPWPMPLQELHDATPEDAFYVHAIEDGARLERWSHGRIVLVGDAAHVVTPNMGQGACMAAEDAFVLATELARNWKWPDGHVEAFYQYEFVRRPFAENVASEARKQLFLGQLSSPIAVWLRETLLWLVPTTMLQKTLKKNIFPVEQSLHTFDSLQVA